MSGEPEGATEERPYDPNFEQARELFLRPPKFQARPSLFTISLILFVAIGFLGREGSLLDLALLVGVLIVHELGHAVAMQLVGFRDVRIFFIPLLGAAASGRRTNVATWKEALVLLAGPVPGIVAAYVLAIVGIGPELPSLVFLLVGLNALNLLPIFPLDGGQLFRVLVFSRHRVVEVAFLYVTAGVLTFVSLFLEEWLMAGVGFFVLLLVAPQRRRLLHAAHELRSLNLPADPAALDEAQTRLLHRAAWQMVPAGAEQVWRDKPQPQAEMMLQLLETATQRPPGAGATVGLFGIWLGAWALAFLTVLAMPRPGERSEPVAIVDWLGDEVAGLRSSMSPSEVIESCARIGTPSHAHREFGELIQTVVCDVPPRPDFPFARVEVWYCGAQACVIELVSHLDTQYVTLGNGLEKMGRPEIVKTYPRCAPHDGPACPRRSDQSQVWISPDGTGVRLTRTVNAQPGDAPVYLTFASREGRELWR
jgi:Zn-dependent protease